MAENYNIRCCRGDSSVAKDELYPLDEDTAEEIEDVVEDTMSDIYEELTVERKIDIEICRTERDVAKDRMHGVEGYADSYDNECGRTAHKIYLGVNSDIEGWKECLKALTAHEYAHIWYSEKRDSDLRGNNSNGDTLNWENILKEGHAMLFAEYMVDFQTPWREPEDVELEEINPDKLVENLCSSTDYKGLLFGTNSEWKGWTGYAVGYEAGRIMVREHDNPVEGIKAMVDKSEEEVIEAVREVF